jgi:hypothetical protein
VGWNVNGLANKLSNIFQNPNIDTIDSFSFAPPPALSQKSDGLKRFRALRCATRGRCPLDTHELFEKSSTKNFSIASGIRGKFFDRLKTSIVCWSLKD